MMKNFLMSILWYMGIFVLFSQRYRTNVINWYFISDTMTMPTDNRAGLDLEVK